MTSTPRPREGVSSSPFEILATAQHLGFTVVGQAARILMGSSFTSWVYSYGYT
jgi:hypothetical protein